MPQMGPLRRGKYLTGQFESDAAQRDVLGL